MSISLSARQRRRIRLDERPPMDPNRDSYVYRIFDERGGLIYIGCSVNPLQRLQGHVGKVWWQYAHRMVVEGPWPRTEALHREAEAIFTEDPYFNAQLMDGVDVARNGREAEQRVREAGLTKVDEDGYFTEGYWQTVEDYREKARDTHPFVDEVERHARYLNDCFDLNWGVAS